jgi:hypothetical protein
LDCRLLKKTPESDLRYLFFLLKSFSCLGEPMPTLKEGFASVTHFIRILRGGSQPILAQASDGHTYVVKFANNLQGPNLLFNESAGSELYRACGLAVPEWRPLWVSENFLDNNPDCWMQTPEGRLRPASGLCFGSRFLGENGKRLLEILPGTSFKRVPNPANFWLAWLIDVCAEHVDNRQAVFTEDAQGWLCACFVDFGHFFGGPKGDMRKSFRASRYLDSRIYAEVSSETLLDFECFVKALDADRLWKRIEAIPPEWKQESALIGLERCLQKLSMPLYLQSLLSTMTGSLERRPETKSGNPGNERKPLREVLRHRVQGAKSGWNFVHHPVGV